LPIGDTLDLAMVNVDLEEYVARVDRTLDHFKFKLEKRSSAGNHLIRMAPLPTRGTSQIRHLRQ
jgi:hypothetical protein